MESGISVCCRVLSLVIRTTSRTISLSTKVAQLPALATKMLGMLLLWIPFVQTVGFFQWILGVREYIFVALLTPLTCIFPTVGAHPAAITLVAMVFPKTSPVALVRGYLNGNNI